MQFRTTELLLLLGAMALPASGVAQTTPAPLAITRTVVAATKLPTVTDAPLHFKAPSITLQPDEKSGVSAANGILYQVSGSTEVSLGGGSVLLSPAPERTRSTVRRTQGDQVPGAGVGVGRPLPQLCTAFNFLVDATPNRKSRPRYSCRPAPSRRS